MADNLTVKLGADTSEFRGQIQAAAASVGNSLGSSAGADAGGRFITAFEHKVFGARHLSAALATALGLNFENIAHNIARFITGVSKEEEEAYKKQAELGDRLFEQQKKLAESRLSDQQLYKLRLVEIESLENRIANTKVKNAQDDVRVKALAIDLTEKQGEAEKLNAKIQGDADKEGEKYLKFAAEIKKKDAEAEAEAAKKRGETQKKNLLDEQKLQKELANLKYEAMTPDKQLDELLKRQLELQKEISFAIQHGGTNLEAEVELQRVSNDISAKKLEIEKATTDEIEKQNKERMTASGDLGVAKAIGGFATYNTPEQQQAYEKQLIESARADTQEEIATLQNKIDAYTKSGSALGKYEVPALQQRIQALKGRESHLQDFVFNPNYQDLAGKGLFAQQVSTIGDPLKLQAQTNDTLQQVAVGVNDLNTRLHNAGFGTGK